MAIFLVTRLPELPPVAPLFMGLPLALFGLSRKRTRPFSAFFLGLLFVLHNAASGLKAALPEQLQGKDLQVIGRVSNLPGQNDGIVRFRFRIEAIAGCESCWTGLASISWYNAPVRVRPGDRFQLNVRLSKPGASLNP
ncbi:MAG: DUF4131 domain-containing protein, partial [Proteobacteria bacterium]|nr:DUF4131 domain-containing protein [Pseudomonadota bacterium]